MSVLGLSHTWHLVPAGVRDLARGNECFFLWLASNGSRDRPRTRRPKKTIDFFLVVASASPLVPENPNAISGTVRAPKEGLKTLTDVYIFHRSWL